jgi:hypothetical protein
MPLTVTSSDIPAVALELRERGCRRLARASRSGRSARLREFARSDPRVAARGTVPHHAVAGSDALSFRRRIVIEIVEVLPSNEMPAERKLRDLIASAWPDVTTNSSNYTMSYRSSKPGAENWRLDYNENPAAFSSRLATPREFASNQKSSSASQLSVA